MPVIYSKRRLSIAQTIRLIIKYRLFDLTIISKYKEELPIYVNHKFYELYITNLKNEISGIEHWLASNNEETNLKRFIEVSKAVFNAALFKKYSHLEKITFTIENYRKSFDAFVKRYPVILSSTLSLQTSIPKGYLFDYLIIDEASQVDVIKSAVCFSCCRNAIVVGDSMQLSHIVDKGSGKAAEKVRNEYDIPLMYDYAKKNILDSLKILYKDKIESVLLKEHYRCHPIIIGFCNKKYYQNKLVIMTSADNHPFKIIETRVHGEIGNYNQRQIHETNNYIREEYSDYTKIGVVAPYRDHANKLQMELPPGVEADTIHKFQGREKDVIIFNTVKAEIEPFMDNPNLINVAVSRSVKEFIIVKPASMQTPHGTNIGDLIRYMYYTTDPERTLVPGRISSVFDLLYKEFNHIRIPLLSFSKNINGSPAEVIIYKLLHETLLSDNPKFSSVDLVREYYLRDLIRDFQPFSQEEIRFIKSDSRIDFLLYNKVDKEPVLAIEVDGMSFHNNVLQQERDKNKDHILKKIKLPLLRLSTNGYNEETRIIEELTAAMALGGV